MKTDNLPLSDNIEDRRGEPPVNPGPMTPLEAAEVAARRGAPVDPVDPAAARSTMARDIGIDSFRVLGVEKPRRLNGWVLVFIATCSLLFSGYLVRFSSRIVKMMHLKKNWRKILRYAWSIKLLIVAAIFAACEVALPLIQDMLPVTRGVFATLSAMASAGGLITRILVQKQFGDDP